MTVYEPRPERPSPKRDGAAPLVFIALAVLICACLMRCDAKASEPPRQLVVPSTFIVMVLPPPVELRCADRGTRLLLSHGAIELAHWYDADPVQRWIEFVPADPVCVFADAFEIRE